MVDEESDLKGQKLKKVLKNVLLCFKTNPGFSDVKVTLAELIL